MPVRPRKAAFCHDITITVGANPYIVILLTVFLVEAAGRQRALIFFYVAADDLLTS